MTTENNSTNHPNDNAEPQAAPTIPPAPPSPVPAVPPAADMTVPPAPPAAPTPMPTRKKLGVAAFVVGIVALVFAVIPGLSFLAFAPALVATGLGIAALASKSAARKRSITAVILGPVALVIAIAVSVSVIAGAAGSVQSTQPVAAAAKNQSQPSDNADSSASDVPSAGAAESAAPKPAADPTPADVVYRGTGDSVLKIANPDGADAAGVATITHKGSSNFAIWSLGLDMSQQDLLVNTIGSYTGTVLFDVRDGEQTAALGITADGAWTVTLHSLKSLRAFDGATASGTGDDVVIYQGEAGAATISHDGTSNFSIWSYGSDTDLVVNEIGAYSGTARWSGGPSVIAVKADGNWKISVG
jgi:hypothetical protein